MSTLRENVSTAPVLQKGNNREAILRPTIERSLSHSQQCRESEVSVSRWVPLLRALVFLCSTLGMLISLLFLASKRQPMGETALEFLHSLMRHDFLPPLLLAGSVIAATGISIILVFVGLALSIVNTLIHPQRKEHFITLSPFDLDLPAEEVSFPSFHGTHLVRGIYIARQDATTTILISPDYRRTFTDALSMCKHLWVAGHNILAFEYYGHGTDVGTIVTLGYREINDFLGAVSYAKQRAPEARIGALGYSMGGAISIMGSARTPEVLAVVADSAFAAQWNVVEMAVRRSLRLSPNRFTRAMKVLRQITDLILVWRAGYHFHQVEPRRDIAQLAPRPVLLIHGLDDTVVHPGDSVQLYEAAGKPRAIWQVAGADHIKAYVTDPVMYTTRVTAFFDRYLRQSAPLLSAAPAYQEQVQGEETRAEEESDSSPVEATQDVSFPQQRSSTLAQRHLIQGQSTDPHNGSPASSPVTKKPFPRSLWILFTGIFINRLGSFVSIFLVLYTLSRGYSLAQAGITAGVYGFGSMGASLAGGYLADRIGRRFTIVFSMLASAIPVLILSQVSTLSFLILFAGLAGLTTGLYRPAASALLVDLVPSEQRVKAFAWYRLALNLGFAAGPALAGVLASHNFSLLFFVDAASSLLFGSIALVGLPSRRERNTMPSQNAQVAEQQKERLSSTRDFRFPLFLLGSTAVALVYFQMDSTLPLQVTAIGLSKVIFGFLLSLNGIIVLILELPLSTFTQRFSPKSMIAAGWILTGLGFGLTAFASNVPFLALTVVLWTLGEILHHPASAAYVADLAPGHMRGRYQGAWEFTWSLAQTLGPLLGVLAFSWSPTRFWLSCGALACLAAFSLLCHKRPEFSLSLSPFQTEEPQMPLQQAQIALSEGKSRTQQAIVEQTLIQMVARILEIPPEQVRSTGDFFEYGGDSRSLDTLLSAIARQWHISISANDVFDHSVLFHLATLILHRQQQPEREEMHV